MNISFNRDCQRTLKILHLLPNYNECLANVSILHRLTSLQLWFSGVFREYEIGILAWKELTYLKNKIWPNVNYLKSYEWNTPANISSDDDITNSYQTHSVHLWVYKGHTNEVVIFKWIRINLNQNDYFNLSQKNAIRFLQAKLRLKSMRCLPIENVSK